MKRKKHISVFKIGFLLFLLSALFLSAKLYLNFYQKNNKKYSQLDIPDNFVAEDKFDSKNLWTSYSNEEYLVKFAYPNFLTKVEYRNEGGYEYFLVFEENDVSKGKGIAFGVNDGEFEDERKRIKTDILNIGKVKFVKEEKILKWKEALVMEFEPEDEEVLEKRSVLLIDNGNYIFSFSTVPYQMQALIESIEISE